MQMTLTKVNIGNKLMCYILIITPLLRLTIQCLNYYLIAPMCKRVVAINHSGNRLIVTKGVLQHISIFGQSILSWKPLIRRFQKCKILFEFLMLRQAKKYAVTSMGNFWGIAAWWQTDIGKTILLKIFPNLNSINISVTLLLHTAPMPFIYDATFVRKSWLHQTLGQLLLRLSRSINTMCLKNHHVAAYVCCCCCCYMLLW